MTKSADDIAGCRHIGEMRKPDQQHFRSSHRLRGGGDLAMPFQQHLPGPAKPRNAQICQPGNRFALGFQQAVRTATCGQQTGAVNKVHQIGDGHFRFCPVGVGLRQCRQCRGGICGHCGIQHGNGIGAPGPSQHGGNIIGINPVCCHRCCLIQQRQRVTHRSFGGARDDQQRFRAGINLFPRANAGQMRGQHIAVDTAQVKALTA